MARVLVTGSSDGVGLAAARALIDAGHRVTAHARNAARADEVRDALHGAERILLGDMSSQRETVRLAEEANATGRYDAVIHNAGIGSQEPPVLTEDGRERVLAVNAIAPYLLTCLMTPPGRLVYVTSGTHLRGTVSVDDLDWEARSWDPLQAYADSKLFQITVAFAVARRWPGVFVNAMEPGWVPTKMSNYNAPDDLSLGHVTQVWLAVDDEPATLSSGRYFYHQEEQDPLPAARDPRFQDTVLAAFAGLTGVELPVSARSD